jgi:hypothetical protein
MNYKYQAKTSLASLVISLAILMFSLLVSIMAHRLVRKAEKTLLDASAKLEQAEKLCANRVSPQGR